MKHTVLFVGLFVIMASAAMAAAPKSYQVTGPVLEVKDDVIVVEKDKEKWEITKEKDTKVTGDPKVGSKVTIKYQMKAVSIEAKEEAKKEEKKAEPKKK